MLYKLFLYKTEAKNGTALAIDYINDSVSTGFASPRNDNEAARFMKRFDTETIIWKIEKELFDSDTNRCKCKAITLYLPQQYGSIGYIYVATSYEKVSAVLPRLHAIAIENDLVLYDAERKKSYYMDLIDDSYIDMRIRQQELHRIIRKVMEPIWKIRCLYFVSDYIEKESSYVVTIKKDCNVSFKDRVIRFYTCIKNHLRDDEELLCSEKCYKIQGSGYTITYVLEGYKKHPNQIGYVEDKKITVALLERMGVEEAYHWLDSCSDEEKDDVFARMKFLEMQRKYPNPAERFIASVNISKWQQKQIFDIRYSSIGYYGSEILFHIVPDTFYHDESSNISVLKIEEESASFILPFISDVYPNIYDRYYATENHISFEMWERIIYRLKKAKEMILNDTFNPDLKPYIRKFNLFVLADHEEPNYWIKINNNEVQFLYDHRYEVGHLYDVFIRWSEIQLKTHCRGGQGRMFNIQGP